MLPSSAAVKVTSVPVSSTAVDRRHRDGLEAEITRGERAAAELDGKVQDRKESPGIL
jgi:hypothetical protein